MANKAQRSGWIFLAEGGELAAFDWEATSIGPIEAWPKAMRTVLAFVLRSPTPIVTLWGDKGVMIYNDAYHAFAGDRHPSILGTNVLAMEALATRIRVLLGNSEGDEGA